MAIDKAALAQAKRQSDAAVAGRRTRLGQGIASGGAVPVMVPRNRDFSESMVDEQALAQPRPKGARSNSVQVPIPQK